ncbi:MAG: hypothetical protein COU10_01785 [Candidatus Harrisonbacteria bacterium CG10_big_fil_rev_8_21_14_0_10_45_28]|uniref:Thioredoxin domain-containing protein n=1 Tax=Candidatus Harrisonbacteria bacterium CG10_big_fil_rev_8_21_14_0_10_45_28 TaxID=1974586 RepID=A0A2H0UNI0_9BACT|nr:MAG: hypothetical protein COU10_01785 [Candidatus Harrisonbacteria bacterium CG10_big_fil_rev_8_21_14_0_10_45_28]
MEEQKTKISLPISIVIGAIVIGGAIVYSNQPKSDLPAENIYLAIAEKLDLDIKQFKTCTETQKYKDEVNKDYEDGIALGVNATPANYINGRPLIGAYPFDAFKTIIEEELLNPSEFDASMAETDYVLGDPNAPVLMVEFGDYQCPFCAQLFREAEHDIIVQYVNTGKVKLVYRDYPLYAKHPAALPAALAAECAGEQGAYWQYHDALFENQNKL